MDLNRFSVAIERKIAGDFSSYNHLKKEIDLENLNLKQRAITEYTFCFHKTVKAASEPIVALRHLLIPYKIEHLGIACF